MSLDLDFVLLTEAQQIPKCFDCGQERPDLELRDFLIGQAFPFHQERIASTILLLNSKDGKVVAFYSLLNDSLHLQGLRRQFQEQKMSVDQVNRLLRRFQHAKRRFHFPAVKIGRLAVAQEFQGTGIGRIILQSVIGQFFDQHSPAVRFLTVDAVNRERTLRFYERLGFNYLLEPSESRKTIPMYFDLKALEN